MWTRLTRCSRSADPLFYDKPVPPKHRDSDLLTPTAAIAWDGWAQGRDEHVDTLEPDR